MSEHHVIKFVSLLLLASFISVTNVVAQSLSPLKCSPKASSNRVAEVSSQPLYDFPVALSNLGTISLSDSAVCNYLFKHKSINGGAWMLASSDKPVVYKATEISGATSWDWIVPGAENMTMSGRKISVRYTIPGVYAMPTLTITTNNGEKLTYTPEETIKVGGTSEITTINYRKWGETAMLAALPYADNGGYVGGTNSLNIVGWGNLFMSGTDDAYIDGVNVYLHHKPTKFKDDAQLILRVWMTNITSTSLDLTYLPVEAVAMPMKNIKADGEDGAWAPIYDGAVAQFKFDQPLSIYGKNPFFVTVEGFSNDPSTEDFCMLVDIIGRNMDEETSSNMLAHNSFARLKGEDKYLRPINSYGGGTGSFAICPILRTPDQGTGIKAIHLNSDDRMHARFIDDSTIMIESEQDGQAIVTDANGKLFGRVQIINGKATVNIPARGHNLYIVSGPKGSIAKIIR